MSAPMERRPRVLVADDHAEVTTAICRLLSLECDVVGTVADGAAAVDAAQRLQPDVVVVDLNLPTISGLDACRQITELNPQVKVIVFTAMNDPVIRQRAMDMGAAAFVCKVSADGDLLSAVKGLFGDGSAA